MARKLCVVHVLSLRLFALSAHTQEGQTTDFREPNPFASDEAGQVASVAYRSVLRWCCTLYGEGHGNHYGACEIPRTRINCPVLHSVKKTLSEFTESER